MLGRLFLRALSQRHHVAAIRAGEIWKVLVDNETRRVKVEAAADTPGWWQCVDLETGVPFLACEPWFVVREQAGETEE